MQVTYTSHSEFIYGFSITYEDKEHKFQLYTYMWKGVYTYFLEKVVPDHEQDSDCRPPTQPQEVLSLGYCGYCMRKVIIFQICFQ